MPAAPISDVSHDPLLTLSRPGYHLEILPQIGPSRVGKLISSNP